MSLSDEFVFVLPQVGRGSPFLLGSSKRDESYPLLRQGVIGRIEPVSREAITFMKEADVTDHRWDIIEDMLKVKTTKVYVNEEGSYAATPNLLVWMKSAPGKYNVIYGRVVVVITRKTLNTLGIIEDTMRRVPGTDDYENKYIQPVFMTELN